MPSAAAVYARISSDPDGDLLGVRGPALIAGNTIVIKSHEGTPLSALEPYRDLIDIVMVMTVEPGFGGQVFMTEAAPKILPAHDFFRGRAVPGQVHVDGGVNRASAQLCGELGAEVLVVGSVLWKKGHDMGGEIRRIKALADEGSRLAAGAESPHG